MIVANPAPSTRMSNSNRLPMAVTIVISEQLIVQKVFARNLLKDVWQHAMVTGQKRDRSNLCLHSRRSIITHYHSKGIMMNHDWPRLLSPPRDVSNRDLPSGEPPRKLWDTSMSKGLLSTVNVRVKPDVRRKADNKRHTWIDRYCMSKSADLTRSFPDSQHLIVYLTQNGDEPSNDWWQPQATHEARGNSQVISKATRT